MSGKKRSIILERLFLGLFVTFTLIIISTTILSSIFLRRFTDIIYTNVEQRLKSNAEFASQTIVSGDELNNYWTLNDVNDRYEEIRAKMQDFAVKHNLVYVYYMRYVGNDTEQMIIDSDPEMPLGLDYFENVDNNTKHVFETGETVCMKLGDYNSSWEGIIAAYTPVYDSRGNLTAIVGVDLYDVEIVNVTRLTGIFTRIFMICAILLAVTAIVLLLMFRNKARAYQKASIAKSEFLSRMSHEIRTPMNAIIGFTRMAEKASDSNELKIHLKRVSEASAFLLQLINSILDISKIEAGKMQLTIIPASPSDIMDNIQNMLHSQSAAKKIDLAFIKSGDIPKFIYCDDIHLTQILVNLLSNALKFTPDNGKITASLKLIEKNETRCLLEFIVEDNGIGMKQEFLTKIFEAFEQVDGGNTRKYSGTGLGLNISKLLVQLMGGELKVESEEDKGSKFSFDAWFDIVKKEDEPSETEHIPDNAKIVDLSGKTILVFEDNEINQMIADNALRELGADIEFAGNGKIGLDKYLNNPNKYHIILMDIQMPEMDGYQATKLIRSSLCKNAKTIPIIAMSANVFREDIEASLSAGMNAHIGKPFEIDQVISTIYDVLNN